MTGQGEEALGPPRFAAARQIHPVRRSAPKPDSGGREQREGRSSTSSRPDDGIETDLFAAELHPRKIDSRSDSMSDKRFWGPANATSITNRTTMRAFENRIGKAGDMA